MPATPNSPTQGLASCIWDQRIGRFEITGELGRGGMGLVLSAVDPSLDRVVALKLIRDAHESETEKARMLSEARAMARLNHKNVVRVFEAGVDDGQVYLAMERIDGGTLRETLENGDYSWREITKLFVQAGRGLVAAHEMGLVHRDFKPENVLVDRDGRVCVSDFGLVGAQAEGRVTAAALGGPETCVDQAIGTPIYMAPELQRGDAFDASVDQFAFCVALWEALYGQLPFRGSDRQSYFEAICAGDFDLPESSDVPSWVRDVLMRGMSADPSDRYPSLAALLNEFAEDLFRPIAHRGTLLMFLAALVITPAVGTFIEPTFSRLVGAISVASLGCAALLWRVRETMWRNAINRRVSLSIALSIVAMVFGGAGLLAFGAPPVVSRIINPLIAAAIVAVFAVAVDRRAAFPVAIFVAAFFVAAARPEVASLAHSVANGLSFAAVALIWRHKRREESELGPISTPRQRANCTPPPPDMAGVVRSVGRFFIARRLDCEASGDVLEAFDPELQRRVSVWYGHAAHANSIRHPNIVTVFETGEAAGHGFSVMEPLSGRTLASLSKRKDVGWQEVVDGFAGAGRGLAAAHDADIVHRAFSAAYAFVDDDGVRVGGFRNATPAWQHTRAILAPELLAGVQSNAKSDQFSFCAALWLALFGEPFDRTSTASSYWESIAAGPRGATRTVPAWVRRILRRGLSVDPRDRYESMHALVNALAPAPKEYGPGRHLWRALILIPPAAGSLPLLLKGFAEAGEAPLSLGLMALLNAAALLPILLVGYFLRSTLGGTHMSRTLLGAFAAGIGATLLLNAGAFIGDIDPATIELLHLLMWSVIVSALALVHSAELFPAAAALAICFLLAAAWPAIIYVCVLAAVVVLTINLAATLRR